MEGGGCLEGRRVEWGWGRLTGRRLLRQACLKGGSSRPDALVVCRGRRLISSCCSCFEGGGQLRGSSRTQNRRYLLLLLLLLWQLLGSSCSLEWGEIGTMGSRLVANWTLRW